MIHVAELLPDAEELADAHREQLAEQVADKLRQRGELRRAMSAEPDGEGYRVAVAVRMVDGIATAVLRVPSCDPFRLLAAFDRHATARDAEAARLAAAERAHRSRAESRRDVDPRATPAPAEDAPLDPQGFRQ